MCGISVDFDFQIEFSSTIDAKFNDLVVSWKTILFYKLLYKGPGRIAKTF